MLTYDQALKDLQDYADRIEALEAKIAKWEITDEMGDDEPCQIPGHHHVSWNTGETMCVTCWVLEGLAEIHAEGENERPTTSN